MEKFVVGDVVATLFPFSDLKGYKRRPALILAEAEFGNFILCQITSKPYSSKIAIELTHSDFVKGKLPVVSFVRPDKLFTVDTSIIKNTAGQLSEKKKRVILEKVRTLFT